MSVVGKIKTTEQAYNKFNLDFCLDMGSTPISSNSTENPCNFTIYFVYCSMKITIACDNCGSNFDRESREIKRSISLGRRQFCSRECSGKNNHRHLDQYKGQGEIWKYSKNKLDKYSGFREHNRRIRQRDPSSTVDSKYLYKIWEEQKGICPYTGIELEHPSIKKKNSIIKTASLDRIDSSKGYVEKNLQFVSMAINFMKNSMSHEETIELCKIIAKHWVEN